MKPINPKPDTGKPNPFAKLLDRAEYAAARGISYRAAEMEAHKGTGPRVTRIGRKAYYHVDDIEAFIEEQRAKASARFKRQGGDE